MSIKLFPALIEIHLFNFRETVFCKMILVIALTCQQVLEVAVIWSIIKTAGEGNRNRLCLKYIKLKITKKQFYETSNEVLRQSD